MSGLSFKPGVRIDADEWTADGEKISAPEKLDSVKRTLEKDGPVLMEHKFLRGARAPHVAVFDDYEEFITYLQQQAHAGDKISVWALWPFMRDTSPLALGKCPSEDGSVPRKGPY